MKNIAYLGYLMIVIIVSSGSLVSCKTNNQIQGQVPDDSTNHNSPQALTLSDCRKCMVVTRKKEHAVAIVDVKRNDMIMWSWLLKASNIQANDYKWFTHIDEAKPVYNLNYMLITSSSSGGVALIRISDEKVVWYATDESNAHSAEVLPDGNIVVAAARKPNHLAVYHVDTTETKSTGYTSTVDMPKAHNVVWDKKGKLLWTAARNKLYSFKYNFNCQQPKLIPKDTLALPTNHVHDLFPVYGEDALWITDPTGTYVVDLKTMDVSSADTKYKGGKSITSGPRGWPTIIQVPSKGYDSDQVVDLKGDVIFKHSGWKIYKARWYLENNFSYHEDNKFNMCQ